jgi:hypothetical protein
MGSIEADGIYRLMDQQHQQNRGDIEKLQKGQAKLTEEVTSLAGAINGGVNVLKVIGWLFLAVVAALGVWFASLEYRGKVSDNSSHSAVSSTQQLSGGPTGTK